MSLLQLVKAYLMERFNQTRVERQLADVVAVDLAAAPRRDALPADAAGGRARWPASRCSTSPAGWSWPGR